MGNATELLERYQLRKTSCRLEVLAVFQAHPQTGLSENYIEASTQEDFDRATIYRTLKTFLEKGVTHQIFDENNAIKYALCSDACEGDHHQHDHIHFKCRNCDTTTCLDDITVVNLQLPKGYLKEEANYLISGLCPKCG